MIRLSLSLSLSLSALSLSHLAIKNLLARKKKKYHDKSGA
jgi:hypothetical protein